MELLDNSVIVKFLGTNLVKFAGSHFFFLIHFLKKSLIMLNLALNWYMTKLCYVSFNTPDFSAFLSNAESS